MHNFVAVINFKMAIVNVIILGGKTHSNTSVNTEQVFYLLVVPGGFQAGFPACQTPDLFLYLLWCLLVSFSRLTSIPVPTFFVTVCLGVSVDAGLRHCALSLLWMVRRSKASGIMLTIPL